MDVKYRITPLVAIVIAAALVTAGSPLAQSQARRPSLRLVSYSPVTIRGAGFRAREHVRIVVVSRTRVVKRVIASAAGAFVVRVPGADANACPAFAASATGDLGSRASFKRVPGQCAAP